MSCPKRTKNTKKYNVKILRNGKGKREREHSLPMEKGTTLGGRESEAEENRNTLPLPEAPGT